MLHPFLYWGDYLSFMKADNLKILINNKIEVPSFIVVDDVNDPRLTDLKHCKYAVRSNCDVEDSRDKSFAGYFDTKLNVYKEDLNDAIDLVMKSYDRVEGYNGKKSVIVQEMVDSEISGVIFTSNPIGALNELVITYGKGLGCNVVDNKVDTNTYFYSKDDKVFCKYINTNCDISDTVLYSLIDNALNIEKIFGAPMDIEFAVKSEKVYILQARYITTIDEDKQIILDNSNIVESYPGISLPLTQSFAKEIYHAVFFSLITRLTDSVELAKAMDSDLENMVEVCNGRIYYNITNWYTVLSILPFSDKIIPIWQKMLGVQNKAVTVNDLKVTKREKARIVKNFTKLLKTTPDEMARLNAYFKEIIPKYIEMIDNTQTVKGLLEIYEELKRVLGSEWDITLANDMYTFIYTHLAGDKNREYISDIKGLESKKPVIALNKLKSVYKEYGIQSDIYTEKRNNFIEKYGDRCIGELKLETKTYRTNPELLDLEIKNGNVVEINSNSEKEKSNLFITRAKLGIKNREISRMNRSRIFGITRKIMLKIGSILVMNNQIENESDIFYLYLKEIDASTNFKALINRRKSLYAFYNTLPAYSRLIFNGKIVNKNMGETDVTYKTDNITVLNGISTSNGSITAPVVVLDAPSNNIDVHGKIIVAKSTDPGWVYLLQNCVGIITEKGSILSHTAIISRELRIPAVVCVKDATTILKDGYVVELNATNGIITIKEKEC